MIGLHTFDFNSVLCGVDRLVKNLCIASFNCLWKIMVEVVVADQNYISFSMWWFYTYGFSVMRVSYYRYSIAYFKTCMTMPANFRLAPPNYFM